MTAGTDLAHRTVGGRDGLNESTLVEAARSFVRTEASAVANLADQLDSTFVHIVSMVLRTEGKVLTTEAGTSAIIAERLAHLLSVSGTQAFHLPALAALHGHLGAVQPTDLVIAISKGGQTDELVDLLARLTRRGIPPVTVTEKPLSAFAEAASVVQVIRTEPASADVGTRDCHRFHPRHRRLGRRSGRHRHDAATPPTVNGSGQSSRRGCRTPVGEQTIRTRGHPNCRCA